MEHKFKIGDKVKVHYLTGNRIGYIQERKPELRYDIRYGKGCVGHDVEENRIVKYDGNVDNEIKVGDKVRVLNGQFANKTGVVVGIIACNKDYSDPYYEVDMDCQVPNKYKCRKTLITPNNVVGGFNAHDFEVIGNVEDEAKEPKIKAGDRVRNIKNDECGIVLNVEADGVYVGIPYSLQKRFWKNRELELVQSKEQTEGKEPKFHFGDIVSYEGISGRMRSGRVVSERSHFNLYTVCSGIDFFSVEEEALSLYDPIRDGYISPIESEPCNTDDTGWDAYTADLARDIALKVANKYNDPKEAAEYAVKVAKAAVENLKRK